MKIKFLGATETVTGSKYEISHRGYTFLLDCGLYQGSKELRDLNRSTVENIKDYQAVLLTHAHIDHSGYLPCLVKQGFRNKIFCSHASVELCKVLLMDAAKLQQEDAEYSDKTKHSKHFPAEPLYTTEDAVETLRLLHGCDYNQWIKLSEFISFRLIRNGHILGSASIQIQFSENNTSQIITFTGDLGGGRSQVIKEAECIFETDYLVSESTYGDRNLKPLIEDDFAKLIQRVYQRQGTLVIPAFSVGRTQEILYIIKKLQQENKISTRLPIYLDSPMAQKACAIYTQFPQELKLNSEEPFADHFFQPENFRISETTEESQLLCQSDFPKIVISASGMLQGGRVLHHLRATLPSEKNAVLFTGYQGQGTKGLLLKNGLTNIRIHHKVVNVNAEITSLDSLSAHADSDELMAWYKNIKNPPKQTFLTHGEKNALGALKYRIETELGWNCIIPKFKDEFDLTI